MDLLSTSALFSQFLNERRYLQNVTASTIEWYETAFKALQKSQGHEPELAKGNLQGFVVSGALKLLVLPILPLPEMPRKKLEAGVRVWARLKYDAPEGALTLEMRDRLFAPKSRTTRVFSTSSGIYDADRRADSTS